MIKPVNWALLGTMGWLGLVGAAQSTVTMAASQSSFNAAVASAGVDDLDSVGVGQLNALLNRSAGSYTYLVASAPGTLWGATGSGSDGLLSTDMSRARMEFSSLSGGVTRFGLDFVVTNALGAALSGTTVDVTVFDASNVSSAFQFTTGSSASFVGFLSDSGFNSIIFSIGNDASLAYSTINNVRMGVSAVPEPGSYALMLGGLALLGAVARRRRQG